MKRVIKIIGSFVDSEKIRKIEINPSKEIDNTNDVIKLEMKISSCLMADLKLFDNKNKLKEVNIIKLIINFGLQKINLELKYFGMLLKFSAVIIILAFGQ